MLRTWLTKRKIKKMESDLYWINAEVKSIADQESIYCSMLRLSGIAHEREISKLQRTLSKGGSE